MEIRTDRVQVPNGELEISAYLAQPTGEGKYPGVIVFQEIFGVNEHIRDVTAKIAQWGYVAIAPALYQRTAPDFEIGYTPDDITLGRSYKEKTTAAELLSDTSATIQYLTNLPNVNPQAINCIGFCFGGHVAYLAATLPEIKATASFYGAGIVNSTPGGGPPTISRTPEIQGTIYLFFGTSDPLIPNPQVDEIEVALQKHQISHRVFRYEGAGHGFICDRRNTYHPSVATAAWKEVQQLFSQTL